MSGTLYIVATPIGNLEDITYRAVRILKEVDLVAAEDTRHSLKLLNHFNISKPLTSYFDHNQQFKGERILNALRQGKSVIRAGGLYVDEHRKRLELTGGVRGLYEKTP